MYVPSSSVKIVLLRPAPIRPLDATYISICLIEVAGTCLFMLMSFYAITHMSKMSHFFPQSSLPIFYDSGFGYVRFGSEVIGGYENS